MDELTELIEDEVIADQQPNIGVGQTRFVHEDQLRKMSLFDRQASWPDTKTVVEKTDAQKVRNADSAVHLRTSLGRCHCMIDRQAGQILKL